MPHFYHLADFFTLSLNGITTAGPYWNRFPLNIPDGAEPQADISVNYLKTTPAYENEELYDISGMSHMIRRGQTLLLADEEWRNIALSTSTLNEDADMLMAQMFLLHAVRRGFLHTHSSLIDCRGKGILFLGPSGIGKTTQAELWQRYRDAKIINGDMAFVQETEDGFYGWGTPWHGSSPYCENAKVKLSALVRLKQAKDNSIRKLEGFEKLTALSGNIFYPRLTQDGMELCLQNADHLLNEVPVYELSCRPDEDAVKLLENTIVS